MKRIAMLAVTALLAAPATMAAQQNPIEDAFARVAEAGIPISLLQSLQAEGEARGVTIGVLEDAMQRRADALIRAKDAMNRAGVEASEAELAAGADALGAGVSGAVLTALAENTTGDQRVAATAALGVLVDAGHVPADALERVKAALERGPDALADLRGEALDARARRGPPSSVFDRAPLGVPVTGAPEGRPTPPRRPGGSF
ncbi:MAG TPA: hypothetical protein VMM12_11810 [Longimicrobiales bacterium]|nr:hypothetical protein [Longimicrobiales bacterium]